MPEVSDRFYQSVSCMPFKFFDGTAGGFRGKDKDHN